MLTFASIYIISPAGAATAAALPSTNNVLSSTLLTISLPIRGALNGGSSSVKELLCPLSIVILSSLDDKSVASTPKTISPVSSSAAPMPPNAPEKAKNMLKTAISAGNRPLQGIKQFVTSAIIRSLGLSIMRQPTAAAALQPRPISIVSACLPHAPLFLKALSILNAARGR